MSGAVQGGVGLALWCSIKYYIRGRGEKTQLPNNLDCTYIDEEERVRWRALSDPSFTEDKIVNALIGINGGTRLLVSMNSLQKFFRNCLVVVRRVVTAAHCVCFELEEFRIPLMLLLIARILKKSGGTSTIFRHFSLVGSV